MTEEWVTELTTAPCARCKGSGTCAVCEGDLQISINSEFEEWVNCPECDGTGQCPACGGAGALFAVALLLGDVEKFFERRGDLDLSRTRAVCEQVLQRVRLKVVEAWRLGGKVIFQRVGYPAVVQEWA